MGDGPPLPVLALFGPTACGKTDLALALADRRRVHLINGDAVQVYRDLGAGTARPRGGETRHPWALTGWLEPTDPVDVARWLAAAAAEIRWAVRAGRLPVVAGGSGLYLRALVEGLSPAPGRQEGLRRRLRRLAEVRGRGFLHRILGRLDPEAARRLAPADLPRVIRALEVRVSTGRSLLAFHTGGGARSYRVLEVGVGLPRPVMDRRIDRRVERFLRRGLVAEVRWLLETRGLAPENHALRAIGYRETVEWLRDGRRGGESALCHRIQRHTRRLARRQLTWFRGRPRALWLDPRWPGALDRLVELVDRHAKAGAPA
ncbi:MAG: tRNA (adenosine(37)-N6)-dimethylallyltransferase MiaA [Acidobacteriota bacterium]|nr:tRNA (adenosine(37)-N6)-dimethylallyltransferase MiaA [Acidobacteriota bacterium]MDQ7088260.1 tRNA (adenosine(37)-N6)-dimethylallyltransferase MiaA [Acidobacteriota bacterium]